MVPVLRIMRAAPDLPLLTVNWVRHHPALYYQFTYGRSIQYYPGISSVYGSIPEYIPALCACYSHEDQKMRVSDPLILAVQMVGGPSRQDREQASMTI